MALEWRLGTSAVCLFGGMSTIAAYFAVWRGPMSVGALLPGAAASPLIALAASGVPTVVFVAAGSAVVEAVSPRGQNNTTMLVVPASLA
jgi:hypothetical protein